nr:uncharacterized protein LOC116426475 [Nomia melanderi]
MSNQVTSRENSELWEFKYMADDPNRDILPVKEGSYTDTFRSSIDPRERHSVIKLDRYELEDKYLRLLDEASNLKKLSNIQEDKIKRLATKLMRAVANPRPSSSCLNVCDDKNKLIALELENSKLKDKIVVLRNQLLSHTIHGRTSSRSRNPQTRPSSGRTTGRSENSRIKIPSCHCIVETVNTRVKVEELETQKKEMANRIVELEKELSSRAVNNQREKVAENVEYIRCWRQMKQMNDKLIAVENTNETLNAQINDLRRMLQEATKKNEETTSALLKERKRSSELDEEVLKAKSFELALREKDERIRDLMNEIKIVQQHNNELVVLSSKKGEIELENVELKKKVSEQRKDQETLRTAYNSEQANIVTLQASNEQLFGKLQELQKNIDSLTSFQSKTEKQETQIPAKPADNKIPPMTNAEPCEPIVNRAVICKKCCEEPKPVVQLKEKVYVGVQHPVHPLVDKYVQTEFVVQVVATETNDQGTSMMTPVKEKPRDEERTIPVTKSERTIVAENSLTPETMLKLLEQAQITAPVDSSKFAHKNVASNVDYNVLDLNQRHSDAASLAQRIPACQSQYEQQTFDACPTKCQSPSTDKMLSVLFNIFQELSLSAKVLDKATNLYRPAIKNNQIDVNNNIDATCVQIQKTGPLKSQQVVNCPFEMDTASEKNRSLKVARTGCSSKKFCSNVYNRLRREKFKKKGFYPSLKRSTEVMKLVDNADCTCSKNLDCEHRCCDIGFAKSTGECCNSGNVQSMIIKNSSENGPAIKNEIFDSMIQNNGQTCVNTLHMARKLQDEDSRGPYRSKNKNSRCSGVDQNELDDANMLQEYIAKLNRCRQILDKNCSPNGVAGISVKEIIQHAKFVDPLRCCDMPNAESMCSRDCPDECVDIASSVFDTFPLVIPDGQGLVELHVLSLQLSTSAKQVLFRENDMNNVRLFISWNMWDQETAFTPTLKCPNLNFNSSIVYRISNLFYFFNYLLSEVITFQVNVHRDDSDSYLVATGKLFIKDILDYPQNKLHYIAPMNSVIPCSLGVNFGQLSFWVRLSCDVEQVEAFKKKLNLPMQPESRTEALARRSTAPDSVLSVQQPGAFAEKSFISLRDEFPYNDTKDVYISHTSPISASIEKVVSHPTVDETQLTVMKESASRFQLYVSPLDVTEEKDTITIDNTKEKSDFADELGGGGPTSDQEANKKTASKVPNESSSVREFNAVLKNGSSKQDSPSKDDSDDSLKELNDVLLEKNWQQYRKRSFVTYSQLKQNGTSESQDNKDGEDLKSNSLEENTIVIEVVNIILFPKCSVMKNPDIQLLYVEYCFLGYCGADMETISVRKPKSPDQKLTYNFRKKFRVDMERHTAQDNILRSMLNETVNPNIKFIVVCEPIPEETESKECIEIGYAHFNIKKYALGDGEKVTSIPIYTPDESEQIGLLKISVLGFDAIRQRLVKPEASD